MGITGRLATEDENRTNCSPTSASTRIRLFAAIWALAAIAHLLNNDAQGLKEVPGWFTLFAAVFLLHDPSSIRRLRGFAAIQLVEVVWIAPLVADHQLLMGVVNLTILLHAIRTPQRLGESQSSSVTFSNSARILVLIAYSGAVLAKYNTTFLDPVTSCASLFAETGSFGIYSRSGPFRWFPVLVAIGSETVIALSLIHPKTRRYGIRYGIAFHTFITVSPTISVEDFSLTLDALFLLFMTDRDIETLATSARRIADGSLIVQHMRRIRSGFVRTAIAAAALFGVGLLWPGFAPRLVGPLALAVGVWFLVNLSRSFDRKAVQPRFERPNVQAFGTAAVLLLAVLSPYLGFRTLGVFTMFSNLRTAGAGTNHLFMPSLNLIDHQNDLVVPMFGSSAEFDQLIEDGHAIHHFEVRRTYEKSPTMVLVGTRGDEPYDSRIDDLEATNWFVKRLLFLRPAPASGEALCTN